MNPEHTTGPLFSADLLIKEALMMDFSQLLEKRRSIRRFLDKDVSLELVMEIIQDACMAPSAVNGQPWEFIVIRNRALIKRLSDESKANLIAEIEKNPDCPAVKYESILRNPDFNVFYNAPCLVLIAGPRDLHSLEVDCALAACYFMLSAASRGLGTCWIGLGAYISDPVLIDAIGLPDSSAIVAPVILGYPETVPPVPARNLPKILKVVS